MPEPIGNISVVIDGDFSALDKSLNESVIAAELGGIKIAEAFTTAAGGTSKLDTAMDALRQQISLSGGELLDWDKAAATGAQEAVQAAGGLDKMAESAKAVSQATAQASNGLGAVADSAKNAGQAASGAADSSHAAGSAMQGWSLSAGDLVKSMLGFAGISLTLAGIKNLIEESLTSFAKLQRATESLTALTGSARNADLAIQQLRQLANDEALSFPALLKADQQMAAFGISTKQSVALLAAAGDASRATGKDFDAVANSVQRIVESGAAMGRTLVNVGLTTKDLGGVMGVASDQATKLFKSLDESTRVEVITAALGKFKGLAQDTSNDLTGAWQKLSNVAATEFQRVGKEISDLGPAFSGFATGAIHALGGVADFFVNFVKTIIDKGGDLANYLKNQAVSWGVSLEDYAAASKKATESNQKFETSIGTLIIAARQMFAPFPEYKSQFEGLLKEFQNGSIAPETFTARLLVMEGQFKSLHPTIGAAADATKSYTEQVAGLKQKLADGEITQAQYKEKLDALNKSHSDATEKTKAHTLSAGELLEKQATLTTQLGIAQAAVDKLTVLEGKGVDVTGALAEAKKQLTKIQNELGIATDSGALAIFKEIELQDLGIKKVQAARLAFIDAYTTYGSGSLEATAGLKILNSALKSIGQDQVDVNGALALFQPELANTAQKIEMVTGASKDSGAALSITTKQVGDQVSILSDLNRGLEIVDTSMLQNILKTGSWTDYLNALNIAQRQAKAESQALDTVEGSLAGNLDKLNRAADGSLIADQKAAAGIKVFGDEVAAANAQVDALYSDLPPLTVGAGSVGSAFEGMSVQIAGSKQVMADAADGAKAAADTLKSTTGPAFDVLTGSISAARATLNALTESYQNQTKMADGHIAKLSEIRKAQEALNEAIKHGKTAYDDIGAAGTKALEDLRASGKSSVQIATQFNQVVDATGGIIQKSFDTGTSAVEKFLAAVGKTIDKLNAMETSILKAAERWDDFQKNLGIAGGIGDNTSSVLAKHLSNPFMGLSSPDEMQKAMNDYMDQFAGSSPFSPGVRAAYTAMQALLNFAIQDWYKKHPFFDSAGNAPGGGSTSTISGGPSTPSSPAGPIFSAGAAPVAPEIQALLNIGATIDQIATLQTSLGTLNTTVGNASTAISGSFASLSPVIQQATTQIATSVQQQAASFSRLSDVLAPITAPQQTISGPLASFQRLPDPRAIGGNSSTLNTVNNMTITTTPDEQSLLDQLVIMLQRRGIRM